MLNAKVETKIVVSFSLPGVRAGSSCADCRDRQLKNGINMHDGSYDGESWTIEVSPKTARATVARLRELASVIEQNSVLEVQ